MCDYAKLHCHYLKSEKHVCEIFNKLCIFIKQPHMRIGAVQNRKDIFQRPLTCTSISMEDFLYKIKQF